MPNQNGNTKITINATRLGPGWLFFTPGEHALSEREIPHWLGRCLSDWLRDHPDARPRAVLPLVSDGNTVGIHLWYDDASEAEKSLNPDEPF